MFAPDGYLRFDEISDITKEISRDLCWAYRSREDKDHYISVSGNTDERSAVQCWLLANYLSYENFHICSPAGILLRGSPKLAKHLDQIEMMPCPIPFEESQIESPGFSEEVDLEKVDHFYRRFIFLDWDTGQIKSLDDITACRRDYSAFGAGVAKNLNEKFAKTAFAVSQYAGWSICIKEADLSDNDREFIGAFGVNEALIEKVNAKSAIPFKINEVKRGRPRIRDEAVDTYWRIYPDGHEAHGVSFKEATNSVCKELGRVISDDTLRRGLGKKE